MSSEELKEELRKFVVDTVNNGIETMEKAFREAELSDGDGNDALLNAIAAGKVRGFKGTASDMSALIAVHTAARHLYLHTFC